MYRECIAGGESKIAEYATTTSAEREMLLRGDRKKKKKKKKKKRKEKERKRMESHRVKGA